jgi:hypothetical protein
LDSGSVRRATAVPWAGARVRGEHDPAHPRVELADGRSAREVYGCRSAHSERTCSPLHLGISWRAAVDGKNLYCQHCHGAPGIVTTFADAPFTSPELEELLIGGGKLTWEAGPLAKDSNLCHGTGGNGYAFLKLQRRTGDAVWLERARAFAMTAAAQSRETREPTGSRSTFAASNSCPSTLRDSTVHRPQLGRAARICSGIQQAHSNALPQMRGIAHVRA